MRLQQRRPEEDRPEPAGLPAGADQAMRKRSPSGGTGVVAAPASAQRRQVDAARLQRGEVGERYSGLSGRWGGADFLHPSAPVGAVESAAAHCTVDLGRQGLHAAADANRDRLPVLGGFGVGEAYLLLGGVWRRCFPASRRQCPTVGMRRRHCRG